MPVKSPRNVGVQLQRCGTKSSFVFLHSVAHTKHKQAHKKVLALRTDSGTLRFMITTFGASQIKTACVIKRNS